MSPLVGRRRWAAPKGVAVLGLVGVLVGAGCQPVDEFDGLAVPEQGGAPGQEDPLGAPEAGLPGSLSEAVTRADTEAARWQASARLAEAVVQVDEDGRLVEGRLTYLAPHADRLLAVEVTQEGLRQERPTLATLDLAPIPPEAVEAVPPLPEGAREPAELVAAAAEAFAACDVDGTPSAVLYATGAPLGWNPQEEAWTVPLRWTATVTTATGGGAVLDPVTATATDCVPPAE
ncbi:MAG TPA: hypothetical protein VM287_11455 [Egibacteraceae bacterium]|nr:hypothetical protein [Egibacteraceae bacterium]